ncbi:tyrosine-type recombinase/integrase [Vibrio splendidus]
MAIKRLENFKIWSFYSPIEGELKFTDASNTPYVTWPNKVPCYEANIYLINNVNKSRQVKGGTLRTYAYQLSHLIKFCFENQITLSQLNDDYFTLFINNLQRERHPNGQRKRSNNRIIEIGKRSIQFLIQVQMINHLENFIGTGTENRIIITSKEHGIKGKDYTNPIKVTSLGHIALPTKEAVKKRLPISDDASEAIWDSIQNDPNRRKRLRDAMLFQLLEQLGARRTEIAMITMKDIHDAISSVKNNSEPSLRLTTLKRNDLNTVRFIPVRQELLSSISTYVKRVRKKVVKTSLMKQGEKDHGYLLISLTTGKQLDTDTITNILHDWKREANVEERVFAHLFRHRFITEKLKEFIIANDGIDSRDNFRKHLLNSEKFKNMVGQWTGHTDLSSLDPYIHLAFEELAGFQATYNVVALVDSVRLMKQRLDQLVSEIDKKEITAKDAITQIRASLEFFEKDLSNARPLKASQ